MASLVDESVLEEFNRTNNDRMIFYQFPEEMLDPTTTNKMFYPIVSFYSIVFFVGLFGNIFAISVMAGDRKSRNATNLFLVSLAAADMLLCGVCSPLETFSYFILHWDEEGIMCRAAKFTELLSASSSVLNLIAVSFERFVVIVYPMRSRSLCTMSNCRRVIAIVWIFSFIMSIPVIFTMGTYKMMYHNNVTAVMTYYCDELRGGLEIAIYKIFILFIIPGVLMMICYVSVIQVLWKSARNMNVLTNDSITNRGMNESSFEEKKKGIRGKLGQIFQWLKPKGDSEIGMKTDVFSEQSQGLALHGPEPHTSNNEIHRAEGISESCPQAQQTETETRIVQRKKNGIRNERRIEVDEFNEIAPAPETVNETNDGEETDEEKAEDHPIGERKNKQLVEGQMVVQVEEGNGASTSLLTKKKIGKRSKMSIKNKGTSRTQDIQAGRKQVIKMLILVVVLFMVSWGPKLIMSLLQKVLSQEMGIYTPGMYKLRVLVNLIPFAHSCINPLIYSFMSKRFREALKRQINRVAGLCGFHPFEDPVPRQLLLIQSTRYKHPPIQSTLPVQQTPPDLLTNQSDVEVPRG